MNQSLDNALEVLRHQLRFLPAPQQEAELIELRSHLAERLASYESIGETPEQALRSSLEKFGDFESYLQQLRYRHYVLYPLKTIWFSICCSTHTFLIVAPLGALGYGLFSWLFHTPVTALDLLGVSPGLVMASVSNRLVGQWRPYKHWGVLGVTLLWMGLVTIIALFSRPKNDMPDSHMLLTQLAILLASAYIPPLLFQRRNAKPTAQ